MVSGTTTLDAAAVLAASRRARAAANAAEAEVLATAVEWAHLHLVDSLTDAATWRAAGCGDTGIPVAGEGAPLVSEFAVAEFATALRLSAESGRRLIGQALELVHRLPRVWVRVQSGDLPAWRARRVAEETTCLSAEAAAFVDQQVAPFAHRVGAAQTQRLVDEAIARFMPDFAAERREQAADGRFFDIDHQQVSFTGTSTIRGELDLADALDLEDAVRTGAEQLATLGSTDSLNVRRAAAVGILARGEQPLDLQADQPGRRRELVLYVHLAEDAIRSRNADAPARVENAGGHLLTADQVTEWCGHPDAKVTVKPVIDLAEHVSVGAYEVPDRLAEQVRLRDRTCAFPWCTRPARGCDLDHITPYDPDGPPGQTNTENLAPLCRRHHRLKTHGNWTYTMVEPGTYLWRSPYGYTYLRDHTGTEDLTDPPVDPPAEPPDQ